MSILTVTGTSEAVVWRAAPGTGNENGDPCGAWQVLAGPSDDDPDICVEITGADCPKQVAEFLAAAAQRRAVQVQFSAVIRDIERAREEAESASGGPLPDLLWVAQLAEAVGKIAAQFSDPVRRDDRQARTGRVYEEAVRLAATAVAWLESHHEARPQEDLA